MAKLNCIVNHFLCCDVFQATNDNFLLAHNILFLPANNPLRVAVASNVPPTIGQVELDFLGCTRFPLYRNPGQCPKAGDAYILIFYIFVQGA
jgi:hypothetical protein